MSRAVGQARGILRHEPGPGQFHHARIAPGAALADLVQHYWIVRWDLRGHAPQPRETLPHPNVHLVLEPGRSRIHGIHQGRFERSLEGQGAVFGVKFRAGGFRPFLQAPVSSLRDRSLPLSSVFGSSAEALEARVLGEASDAGQVAAAEAFLLAHRPPPDPKVEQVAEIVGEIERDRRYVSVERVLERWPLGKRSLQRLFNDYVGIGPKWVINRYRLHEAIERLAGGESVDWAVLAQELGYFDQAHFIRDFKALVGRPPGEYASAPTPTRATAARRDAEDGPRGRGRR